MSADGSSDPQRPLIAASGVSVHVGGRALLDQVSLEVAAGEIVT